MITILHINSSLALSGVLKAFGMRGNGLGFRFYLPLQEFACPFPRGGRLGKGVRYD